MSSKYSNKQVYVKDVKGEFKTTFGRCIFEDLGVEPPKEILKTPQYIHVELNETDSQVFLKRIEKGGIPFGHAQQCPCTKDFDRSLLKKKEVLTAVCCIIENIDTNEVLITQRADYMRTFPNTWY
jgi:ribosome-interacting GTPase 1